PFALGQAVEFNSLQSDMASILRSKTIVGYRLWKDIISRVGCIHIREITRQPPATSTPRETLNKRDEKSVPDIVLTLKKSVWYLMQRNCQEGLVDPIEDARAAMDLYQSHGKWEAEMRRDEWAYSIPAADFSR
ncbi:hypothetical protein DFH09DRAFT_943303, partial [Mycena vulgaris]